MGMPLPSSQSNTLANNNNNPWASGALVTQPSAQQLEQTLQMLENPQMAQLMDSFLSNPALMQNIMASNPMMQQMMQQNPQAARMLQDPQVLRSMMQPDNLRAMMQMQQSMGMGGGVGGFPPGGGWMMPPSPMNQDGMGDAFGGMPPLSSSTSPMGLDFSSLLNQMQATSLGGGPNAVPNDTSTTAAATSIGSVPSSIAIASRYGF
jgi:ubiquilin